MRRRRARRHAALACAAILACFSTAKAEELGDPFALVAPSIARMNFSGFRTAGHCTAVQVGTRAALVAGGCIAVGGFDQLHFLFGYDRQEWAAHRVGQKAFIDPQRSDLKLVCLSGNVAAPRFAAARDAVSVGERVIVAGYATPKPHKVTFRGCTVAQVQDSSGLVLGCGLGSGEAGAPVFTLKGDGARLLGVAVAGNDDATLVLRWTGDSLDRLCPPDPATTASESNG